MHPWGYRLEKCDGGGVSLRSFNLSSGCSVDPGLLDLQTIVQLFLPLRAKRRRFHISILDTRTKLREIVGSFRFDHNGTLTAVKAGYLLISGRVPPRIIGPEHLVLVWIILFESVPDSESFLCTGREQKHAGECRENHATCGPG